MMEFRKATIDDLLTYFRWANDPETRASALHTELISFSTHVEWFKRKIDTPTSLLLIAEWENIPIGQIRFDLVDESYLISYSIDKAYRGRGFGSLLLKEGVLRAKESFGEEKTLRGIVKEGNEASKKAFLRAGFTPVEYPMIGGIPCVVFVDR